MSEILEEHFKDVLWLSTSFIAGFVLFNTICNIRVEFLNNVFENVILIIEEYAGLSAKYECSFTISIPRIPLIDYSILLDGNKYYIIIQGISVFEGEESCYHFNKVLLEAGSKYFIKASGKEVTFVKNER